jgi:glycosyltransferase involved in cell wall biosynthesis
MEYQQLGHEVVLVAHRDSKTNAKQYTWPALHSRGSSNIFRNTWSLFKAIRKEKPDVIHSFGRLLYLYPVFLFMRIPVLMTYGRKISAKSTRIACILAGKKLTFTACGEHMLSHLSHFKDRFTPVHNFTMVKYFVPNESIEKEHLLFLGRIEDIKGTKEAIEVALATNNKLVIAGNIQPGHDEYFDTNIKPHLDNPLIEYVGPVNDAQKLHYLQRSFAFLFPIKWEEPFGIVIAEAMACGVPVIGFKRGSVPEIIKDNHTGFIVSNVEEMIDAVDKVVNLDRKLVRNDCVERFSLEIICQKYLKLFEQKTSK